MTDRRTDGRTGGQTDARGKQKSPDTEGGDIIICYSNYSTICFGCSKEPSHGDGSFEHQQHMPLGAQKNRLMETVHLNTNNICLGKDEGN